MWGHRLARLALVVGTVVGFIVNLVVAVLLHIDTRAGRAVVVEQVNPILDAPFKGAIAIDQIDSIAWSSVGGVRARLVHPDGEDVARVQGLNVRFDTMALLRSLTGDGAIVIHMEEVSIDVAEVDLGAPAGELRIAEVFEEVEPTTPADPEGSDVEVTLDAISIRTATLRGLYPDAVEAEADLFDLDAQLLVLPDQLSARLGTVDVIVRRAPGDIPTSGRIAGAFYLPFVDEGVNPPHPMEVQASFSGAVGSTRVDLAGLWRGDDVHAFVVAPTVTPAALATIAPAAPPLGADASVVAVVNGTLERPHVRAWIAASESELDVDARFATEPVLAIQARLAARRFDARLVGGPATSVSLTATGEVSFPAEGDPAGAFEVATEPGSALGNPVPAVVASGTFAGARVDAVADVREPNMLTSVRAALRPGERGPKLTFEVGAPAIELGGLRRRGLDAMGSVALEADGSIDFGARTIDARARAEGRGLARPSDDARVASADVDVEVSGTIDDPFVDADLVARGITFAGREVTWLKASAAGQRARLHLSVEAAPVNLPHVEVHTTASFGTPIVFSGSTLRLQRGQTEAKARVRRVVVADVPEIEGLEVTGLGGVIRGSLGPTRTDGFHVQVEGEGLVLARVRHLVGIEVPVSGGVASIDADVALERTTVDGHVALQLRDVVIERDKLRFEDVDVDLDATVLGQRLLLRVDAQVPAIGRVAVFTTSLARLDGPPTDPESWRRAVGGLAVDADVDLGRLAGLVPPRMLPVYDVRGRATLDMRVERDHVDEAPSLQLDLRTKGLGLLGRATATPGAKRDRTPTPAWSLRGIDVEVHTACDATAESITLRGKAFDAKGALVTFDLTSQLPYGRLLEGGDPGWLYDVPFELEVDVPRRRLADLPAILAAPHTPGEVELAVRVTGPLREPDARARAAVFGFSIPRKMDEPLDAEVTVEYDGERATAQIEVDRTARRLVSGNAELSLPIADLTQGRTPPWTGSADLRLVRFPLASLQPLLARRVGGHLDGFVRLEGLNEDARLEAKIDSADLDLGGMRYRSAKARVKASSEGLDASLVLDQTRGSLSAKAKAGLAWGRRVVPELRASRELDVSVVARDFRLQGLEPFVSPIFARLDGRLDGSMHVSEKALQPAAGSSGITGRLALRDGEIEAAAGGGLFTQVRARLELDERGILRLQDVYARGLTGEVRASGVARIDRGAFVGAKLNVVIPEDEPVPVLVGGQHLADVGGVVKASVGFRQGGRELRVLVEVPSLRVELPDSLPEDVQKLGDVEHAKIGTVRDGRFVPLALDAPDEPKAAGESAFTTRIDVVLRDVVVVRGDMLETRLVGNPSVLIGKTTTIAGRIEIFGGDVDIKGRLFEIERGVITFTGNPPDNPDVNLTARWEAPDGTVVFADFVGPLQTGKVSLRSNPPRSRQEIISPGVFGSAEGMDSGGGTDSSTQAVGAAGGFAAKGLNQVLNDVTDVEIRTRVDTSSSTNPRPELEVQIARELSLGVSHILGDLPPGKPPDKNFGKLDWNFRPEWSLETTLGDKGSSTVDLVWEHVY